MDTTVNYYNTNAADFYSGTVNANMKNHYVKFENYLPEHATVLDCGCGSGRDTKHFLEKSYNVIAMDGSEELCKKASALTGLDVEHMYFQDISFENMFDGIWACASLLHTVKNELPEIFCKLRDAMKQNGVMYASFKYGDFEGDRNGRYFTDLTEKSLIEILSEISGIQLIETWTTSDVREGRSDEKWLNFIIKKK